LFERLNWFEEARFDIRGQDAEHVRDRLRVWLDDRVWVSQTKAPIIFTSMPTVYAYTELKSAFVPLPLSGSLSTSRSLSLPLACGSW